MTHALIVDDLATNRYLLRALLEATGYSVDEAQDGAQALVRARARLPDIVISDLLMPVMDGYTLLAHWKADPVLARSPFVVYTASYKGPGDERLALSLGADGFFLKPAEPQKFIARLGQLLEAARARPDAPPNAPREREVVLLREYNEVLVRKLEEKMLALEVTNQVLATELAQRERARALAAGEARTLELIAAGAPLARTLETLIGFVEQQSPEMLGSVLLLDPDGMHIRHGAAPLLPPAYNDAIAGRPIGPRVGSCGTAMFRRELVIVEDIASDALWDDFRALVTPLGLRACWSSPVLDGSGLVLGALAMYYRQPGRPSPQHLELIGVAARLAAIAIGHARDSAQLRTSESRLLRSQALLGEAERLAGFGSWDRDLVGSNDYWSHSLYSIYGLNPADGVPHLDAWHQMIHPDDRERVRSSIDQVANQGRRFTIEFRIYTHDHAQLRHIQSRAEVVRDAQDRVLRMWGVDHDISGLVDAQRERAAREGHLRTIIETGPDCVKLLAADGSLLEMNAAGLRMIDADNFEQVAGNLIVTLIAPEHRAAFRQLNRDVFGGASGQLEFQMRGLKGSLRWLETHASPLRDADGRVIALLGVTRDVTERRQQHVALRESEERLRLALEAGRVGIFDWDVPANRISWSRSHEEMWGYGPGEFGGTFEAFAARVHPDDIDGIDQEVERCIASRAGFAHDFRVIWPDRSEHWISATGEFTFAGDGTPLRMRGAVREITERKLANAALYASREQLRLLAARMHRVREEQSTSIAREIHDVLAQELTRLKIDVVWAASRLQSPVSERLRADLATRLQGATVQTDTAISAVQKIATELRPVILDSLGLFAALEWQVEDFARRTGIAARALLPATDEPPRRERATALFRIVQESLTNVARHAQASEVVLQLLMQEGLVELTVRDNGVGLTAAQQADLRSIGLTGMRERAMAFGGSVQFEGVAGGGTTVRVRLPLEDAP